MRMSNRGKATVAERNIRNTTYPKIRGIRYSSKDIPIRIPEMIAPPNANGRPEAARMHCS
jgi:hypothetical protein